MDARKIGNNKPFSCSQGYLQRLPFSPKIVLSTRSLEPGELIALQMTTTYVLLLTTDLINERDLGLAVTN